MAKYSIARRTTDTTNNDACFDVGNGAGSRARLMELAIYMAAATASVFGLNRPTATGTRTTPVTALAEDDQDPASEVDNAIAHSVQPTFASDYFRRWSSPATIGAGVVWTFPFGLVVGTSKTVAVRNLGTNGVSDIHAVVDE